MKNTNKGEEFHVLTIPALLTAVLATESNSQAGRVNWSWRRFLQVVAVVVVSAVAIAIVGAAAGAVWAAAVGLVGSAATAAAATGAIIGGVIGAVGGLIAGSQGYCPDDWFQGGVPLVDWTTDCSDLI